MPLEVRAIQPDELDQMLLVDERAFGGEPDPPTASRSWAEAELPRTRVVFDGGEAVGASRNYSFELTLPGGSAVPAAAVSWVGVAPTHRRRGVLTTMMAALHDDAREHDEPVAMLTASESTIYGRFGYGVATWRVGRSAERSAVQFRTNTSVGCVRMVTRAEAETVLPAIYESLRHARAGSVTRPDYWWPSVFWDQIAGADKAFFVAIHSDGAGHDDGFVAYALTGTWPGGISDRRMVISDMQAADAGVRGALWRFVFGVDLVKTVVAVNTPIDDPLRHLVTDGRQIRVDHVNDGMWVCALDPIRLLGARTYEVEGRLVIEMRAPDGRTTRLALDGGPGGANCAVTTLTPDLVCPTATLGACLLGGNRWSELAQAELVDAHDRDVLVRADTMFMATPTPALLTGF